MPYVLVMVEAYLVKTALLSILLGLIFVTSTLVGIAYATPTMQPAQSLPYPPYYCPPYPPYPPYYYPPYYWTACGPGEPPRDGPHHG